MPLRPLLDADVIYQQDPILVEDTWELFEAVESSFGIDLGEYKPLCGMTITEIAHEVSAKANYPDKEKCLSAVAFYRLRRAFESISTASRGSLRPGTQLDGLLPWKSRQTLWTTLGKSLGLSLPDLEFPRWLFFVALCAPAAALFCIWYFGVQLNPLTMFLAWIVLVALLLRALLPFGRDFPRDAQTLGGLAKVVLAGNYAVFAKHYCGSSEADVLLALQQLIAIQIGKSVDEIPPYTLVPQGLNIY